MGIESASDDTRKDMVKRLEEQKIRTALANLRDAGIKSFGFFIFGYPGDTPQSMDQTVDYAIELDPDFANFYPAVPYPGTELYEKCRREGLLAGDDWSRMEYLVLPAARQRPRRNRRDGRDQPREAPVLPAPGLPREPLRRRAPHRPHQARDRRQPAVTHPVRSEAKRTAHGRHVRTQLAGVGPALLVEPGLA